MMDLDLEAERLAASSLNSRQRHQFEEQGVAPGAIHRCGGLAWTRISTIGGRCYSPSPAGDVMVIQPVWAGHAPSIYQAVEHPVIFDLIAWHPDRPTRWYYRIGDPGAVLGVDHLEMAHAEGLPICFATTPLDWLRGDCRGAMLLEVCEAHWRAVHEADAAAATTQWWGGEAA